MKQIDVPPTVATAFVNERAAQIQIAQRQAEAAGVAELNAQGLNINGTTYVMLKAIENGQVTFWVVPEGSDLNLPSGATGGLQPAPSNGQVTTTTTPTAPVSSP